MKTLPLEALRPGMVLAADAQTLDGRVLLKKGTVLADAHITALSRRGVTAALIQPPQEESSSPASPEEELQLLHRAGQFVEPNFQFMDHAQAATDALRRLALARTAAALQQGFVLPQNRGPDTVDAERLQDLFLREQGTPEDVVLHEVQLASFPDVYFKIIAVLRSPTSSAGTIAEVVSQDPSLSAKLLKLVNSPFYGFPSRIDSLPRAVALVGGNELSTLALGISAISVFKDIPPQLVNMRGFWTHSLRCAIFARLIAARCDKSQQERHFVTGLLHDIGKLLIYKKLPHAAAQTLIYAWGNGVPEHLAESELLGFDHCRIGQLLLRAWNFPKTLEGSIARHHNPRASDEDPGAAVVHVADILSHTAALPQAATCVLPILDEQAWTRTQLDPEQLSELFQDCDILVQQVAGVFLD